MLSFEAFFVEIGQVDLEILDFAGFSEICVIKIVFFAITDKVLGAHKKTLQILTTLIKSFHSSYKTAL